ncbi:unnamed protein product [Linum trigynum]|uniref:UspA domain-containing protein n=1 Tax=Linum trigynum TaxID=586398 RepID=A0AAV2EVT9_9ROSI
MPPSRTRLPRVCGGRSIARVRSPTVVRRSPKPSAGQEMGFLSADKSSRAAAVGDVDDDDIEGFGNNNSSSSNKVMVVVDSSVEAKAALEWALSHTLQTHDSLILLFVAKPTPSSNNRRQSTVHSNVELLYSMKNLCQRKRPGVQVEVIIREGENRGPIIVEEAKRQRVSLLVLGHRKQRVMWRLISRLKSRVGGRRGGGGEAAAVKYCIHNSSCMTIAVRRQGKKLGGYLITTKRHNNFWLLA